MIAPLFACGTDETTSDGLPPTDRLAPVFRVLASDVDLSVTGELIGDGREHELSGGARLIASMGDSRVPLTRVEDPEAVMVRAILPAPAGESTLTIALERSSGAAAPRSSVVVPAPFAIVEVPKSVASGEEVTFVLSRAPAPGEHVKLWLRGCFRSRTYDAKGEGERLKFVLTDLSPHESCEAEAQIYVSRDGVLDEAFAREATFGDAGAPNVNATFDARQFRKTRVQVVER